MSSKYINEPIPALKIVIFEHTNRHQQTNHRASLTTNPNNNTHQLASTVAMACTECTDQIRKGYRYCKSCGAHFHLLESQAKKVTDTNELGISVVSPLRSPHMASQTTTTIPASTGATTVAASTGTVTKTNKSEHGSAASMAATVVGPSTSAAGSAKKSSKASK